MATPVPVLNLDFRTRTALARCSAPLGERCVVVFGTSGVTVASPQAAIEFSGITSTHEVVVDASAVAGIAELGGDDTTVVVGATKHPWIDGVEFVTFADPHVAVSAPTKRRPQRLRHGDPEGSAKLDAKAFAQTLRSVVPAAGEPGSDLGAVRFLAERNELRIAATDRERLHTARCDADGSFPARWLPIEAVSAVRAALPQTGQIIVEAASKALTFNADGVTAVVPVLNREFMQVDAVVPRDRQQRGVAVCPAADVAAAALRLVTVAAAGNKDVELIADPDTSTLRLRSKSSRYDISSTIEGAVTGCRIAIAVPAVQFLQAVAGKHGNVTITWAGQSDPIVVTSVANHWFKAVIAPS